MFYVLGGLRFDQTKAIQAALSLRDSVFSPEGYDDWKYDIAGLWLNHPSSFIGVVAHSLACGTVVAAAHKLKAVQRSIDYMVLIESVWTEKLVPPNVRKLIWIQRSQWFGFPTGKVIWDGKDVPGLIVPGTDHNTVCQAALTLDTILKGIPWRRQVSCPAPDVQT